MKRTLIFLFLLVIIVNSASAVIVKYNFTDNDYAINASYCDDAYLFNPSSPHTDSFSSCDDPFTAFVDYTFNSNLYKSDNMRVEDGVSSSDESFWRFTFNTTDFESQTINSINFTFENYGESDLPELFMFFWNFDTSSWDSINSINMPSTGDILFNGSITSNIDSYIDGTRFDILITESEGNIWTWKIDYVELIVEYQTSSPGLILEYPSNNFNFSYNESIELNFTSINTGSGIDSCWYNIDKGDNYTINSCSNSTFNTTEGEHILYLYNNNTYNQVNETNVSFIVDLTYPTLNVLAVHNITGSQTVKFNHTASDTYLKSCKYGIIKSDGSYDIVNISVNCNANDTQFSVSAFGTYNISLFALDYSGNENYTLYEFSIADTPPIIGDSGGGGGSIITENLTWKIETDSFSDAYDFTMLQGAKRTKSILITNLAEEDVRLEFKCVDIQGDLCSYVNFTANGTTGELFLQTILPPTQFATDEIKFTLIIPEELPDGIYDFNIVATDQTGFDDQINVRANVGEFGIIGFLVSKIVGSTLVDFSGLNDSLTELEIPNWILLIVPFFIVFSSFMLIFNTKKLKEYRFAISLISSFIALIIIFVLL